MYDINIVVLYLLSFEVTCEEVQLSLADLASDRARDAEEPIPAKVPRMYVCFRGRPELSPL